MVEASMESRDGRLRGRPDLIDPALTAVIDYKTGAAPSGGGLTEAEERQLKLYAFLAVENGLDVQKGVIIRADRSRAEISITREAARDEGARAVEVLEAYNLHAGRRFEDAATPAQLTCQFCACIPFCEAFWNSADETWSDSTGSQVEGEVAAVQGDELVTLELEVTRGTTPRGAGMLTRLSERWLTFDGTERPVEGDLVRATDVYHVEGTVDPAIFRADRVSTAVWDITTSDS